jgi:hypothetical protein
MTSATGKPRGSNPLSSPFRSPAATASEPVAGPTRERTSTGSRAAPSRRSASSRRRAASRAVALVPLPLGPTTDATHGGGVEGYGSPSTVAKVRSSLARPVKIGGSHSGDRTAGNAVAYTPAKKS